MALTKIVVTLSLLALCNAGFVWQDDDDGFPTPRRYHGGQHRFSGFSDLMSFPFNFVFSGAPKIPFPSVDDVTNMKPAPGQTYTGIFAHSGGGEHVLVANLNGKVVKLTDDDTTATYVTDK